MDITSEIIESRRRRDEAIRLTNATMALLYATKKDRCEEHSGSCTCEDCDFVGKYEWEQSILHPAYEFENVY